MKESAEIGVIGGTGVCSPNLLKNIEKVEINTPYGKPSSPLTIGTLGGRKAAFLFRHGEESHSIPPHKVNWRANIWALKELGCSRVLATCATGSLKEELKPGDMVIVDQFIDLSKGAHTFYDGGNVYHTGMAEPFCPDLRKLLAETGKRLGIPIHEKGTYIRIEGPQFSTRAASNMYKQFADIIGMTGVPEAILAREKEMCFGIVATVTDYDSWIGHSTPFEEMKKVMAQNLENTRNILRKAVPLVPEERGCHCKDALKGAEA
ncbi:MAG: S-methyl-5'-thioadenosine phosphorylase [Candidatus Aminicenantales bacterium]